jgi:hypothetical protein
MLSDEMKIYHPTWSKYLILPALLLVICIGCAPIITLLFEENPNYESLYFFLPLALFFTYFSFRGYALHKYRNVTVEINSMMQIVVMDKEGTAIFDKSDILYKNYKMLTFVELFNKDKKKIAAFDHIYPNVEEFLKWAKNHLTTA